MMPPVNPNRITLYMNPERRAKWERLKTILREQDKELSLSAMLDMLVDAELKRHQKKTIENQNDHQ